MTEDHQADEPESIEDADVAAPLGNRLGRLAVIVAGVLLAALGVRALVASGDAEEPEDASESVLGISPADLPRGALAGEVAPPIRLEMFSGEEFSLADHVANDGRPIVLNFWASWCFPCRTEMPEFDEVAVERADVQFIGIAIEDNRAPALEFAEEIQVSYPLGIDETGDIGSTYPHVGLPTTYFINGDGTVARQIQGQVSGALLDALIEFDFG